MTGDRDEALGRLADELAAAMAAGESIVLAATAERFRVEIAEVQACLRALQALDTGLGEEAVDGWPELPAPQLPDDYELRGELGRGGMGVVYRAHQRSLDRDVAIKVLRPGDLLFGDALRRFRTEAKSLARLRHRHIVSVHDLGESKDGTLWFAMDLIDGRTLADELQRNRRLLPSRAVRLIRQIAAAVAHAHAHGIVHRDLKPQNVLIDRQGDAFVVDFGLARDAAAAGARTLTGELLGTPAYMSPEQARGDSSRIGEASDVWALGALLYELLTGHGPFSGKPLHETIRAILEDDPVPPSAIDARVPAELEAVCLQALRKRPEDRYTTALAFAEDIERFADGRGVLAKPPSRWVKVGRTLRRHGKVVAMLGIAVIGTLSAVHAWLPSVRHEALVAEAERLLEQGHAEAAIASLRRMMDSTAAGADERDGLELLLARAGNDRAAQLVYAGNSAAAALAAADALATTSRAVNGGAPWTVEREHDVAWKWELARARAASPAESGSDASSGNGELTARLLTELRDGDPARATLACRVAARVGWPLAGFDDPDRLRLLEPLVAAAGRSIDAGDAETISRFPFHWTGADVDAWWSRAVEDKLAELAVQPSLTTTARAVAFRAFCQLIGLPTFDSVGRPGSSSDVAPTADRIAAAAPTTIAAWQRWRLLPREEAMRQRVDLLVDAAAAPGMVLPGTEGRLAAVVRDWTGLQPPSDRPLATWWRDQREQSFAALLRTGLGLAPELPIDVAGALDTSITAPSATAMLWRQLAWLQVPAGVPLLTCEPHVGAGGWLWRRNCLAAAGHEDSRHFTVHTAVLRFDDGDPRPRLLVQQSIPARLGQPVTMAIDVAHGDAPWFSFRRAWEDERRRALELPGDANHLPAELPRFGRCRAHVAGHLLHDADGIRFTGNAWIRAALPELDYHESPDAVGAVGLEATACFAAFTARWDDRRRLSTFLQVVHVVDGESGGDLDLETWRLGAVRLLQEAAAAPAEHWRHRAIDWLLPSCWSLPEAATAMTVLDEQRNAAGRAARHALHLAGVRQTGAWWIPDTRYWIPMSLQFVSAAIAAPNQAVRTELLEALAKHDATSWTPAIAATLRRAATSGTWELPPQLAMQLAAQPEPGGLVDRIWRRRTVNVVACVLGLAVCSWQWMRHPAERRRLQGVLGMLVLITTPWFRVQFDGHVWTPTWLGLAIGLALCITAARDWPWHRLSGAFVSGACVVWSVLAWFGIVAPSDNLTLLVCGAAFLTSVPWRMPVVARRGRGRKPRDAAPPMPV